MDCERCGKDVDTHPTVDVSNTDRLALCQDRAIKWQRVEPGTVVPAGQPYRIEVEPPFDTKRGTVLAEELVMDKPQPVNGWENNTGTWFIDSSWKPPLVLPTEQTWGIAVHPSHGPRVGMWALNETGTTLEDHRQGQSSPWAWQGVSGTTDFIPLTDEQVARIEAAR